MNAKNFWQKALVWVGVLLVLTTCSLSSGESSPTPPLPPGPTQPATHTLLPGASATLTGTAALLPTFTPTATDISTLVETIKYIHLRIEFTSHTDWAGLELLSPGNLLAASEVSTSGALDSYSIAGNVIGINQPIAAAQSGAAVGIVVDYAFHKSADELNFRLTKGDLNGCQVKFYAVVGENSTLLTTINHYNIVPNSQGVNPYPFTLTLRDFPDFQLNTKEVHRLQIPKMVWAFYYPWYIMDHWNSNILIDRPETPYASNDPEAIARHIEQAQSAGIDGFISSWWGPNSPDTDPNLQILLDLALESDFAVTIYFETLTGNGPLNESHHFELF